VPDEGYSSRGDLDGIERLVPDKANPKDLIGATKAPLNLVPPALFIEVAPVMALGAKKYGPYNWRESKVKLSVYLTAILRHTLAALDGQWEDPESGRPHVAHVGAGVGIILDADASGQLIDDLPKPGPAAKLLAALAGQDGSLGVPAPEDRLPLTATEAVLESKRRKNVRRGITGAG
jgi:hypothetical protein